MAAASARARAARGAPCAARPAFTLVELMVVIGIAAMIMAIGVPTAFRVVRKNILQQAISDITEACSEARAQAVLHGYPAELCIRPQDRTIEVRAQRAPAPDADAPLDAPLVPPPAEIEARPAAGASVFTARLADDLILEMVDVNFQEYKDAEIARVRFFPNGTTDFFTIVLQWPRENKYRKISLDVITGLADLEVIR